MQDPLFKKLNQILSADVNDDGGNSKAVAYSSILSTVASDDETADIVTDAIAEKLCKELSIPESDIDASRPLHNYSVDSLVTVEWRTWFMKEIGANVAVFDIMGRGSIRKLSALVSLRNADVTVADVETMD